ncbi:hypothetical protein [Sulfobacillus thermosulfidooxidans]|uniref:hypothetical protein n=1 Tax=Sulfobacillus thermosulfidooxidans TaxID=28034 RepID=UPI00048AFBF1|nr:hypothetical protein [Sulfobacillus thermosulfidooxidans]
MLVTDIVTQLKRRPGVSEYLSGALMQPNTERVLGHSVIYLVPETLDWTPWPQRFDYMGIRIS